MPAVIATTSPVKRFRFMSDLPMGPRSLTPRSLGNSANRSGTALSRPGAGAGAGIAATGPSAGAALAGQSARTAGFLIAAADIHLDGAIAGDCAGHRHRFAACGLHLSARDPDFVAVGTVA